MTSYLGVPTQWGLQYLGQFGVPVGDVQLTGPEGREHLHTEGHSDITHHNNSQRPKDKRYLHG